ncbi:MAG TPA: DUF1207 domain-containing protein [Methylomirabilota bacterium]|nr:DUF1207 domain-containing protein [Methylomirabilota bacterium]
MLALAVGPAVATAADPMLEELREPPGTPPTPRELELGFMPRGELFTALIADPRWPHFSAAYHYYLDDPDFKNIAAVSFGETFAIYRDRVGQSWWELGLQAGVFAVFDLDTPSFDLINSDYFVAATVAYRYRGFSALARLFHQSSHLGDEFLLRQTNLERVNLSYEGVDMRLSYEFLNEALRLYAGAGYLFNRTPDDLDPWSTQAGIEVRSPWPGPQAGWRPVAAVDVQNREENRWATDISVRAGVEFSGVLAPRTLQVLIEYFAGHSPNGQFYRNTVDYLGLGLHFHF